LKKSMLTGCAMSPWYLKGYPDESDWIQIKFEAGILDHSVTVEAFEHRVVLVAPTAYLDLRSIFATIPSDAAGIRIS
jgi:hypothetical protein